LDRRDKSCHIFQIRLAIGDGTHCVACSFRDSSLNDSVYPATAIGEHKPCRWSGRSLGSGCSSGRAGNIYIDARVEFHNYGTTCRISQLLWSPSHLSPLGEARSSCWQKWRPLSSSSRSWFRQHPRHATILTGRLHRTHRAPTQLHNPHAVALVTPASASPLPTFYVNPPGTSSRKQMHLHTSEAAVQIKPGGVPAVQMSASTPTETC